MIPPYLGDFFTTGSTFDTRSLVSTNPLPAASAAAGRPRNTRPAGIDVHCFHALARLPTPLDELYWHGGLL
ncbi:Os01g0860450 [Oryza sativa Japonica Group]|uniref:Os01g0860450 protein n=1 Tax=Oryza sativa subsp. japonica TaxID=39947 RepID=A0A0P0VAQ1_ORYSJ|nr:hypothetical protein EE612_006957 [Oryza sativa]BAS75334.1 Os01g0860450 [Oryza sativa Japonica Group]